MAFALRVRVVALERRLERLGSERAVTFLEEVRALERGAAPGVALLWEDFLRLSRLPAPRVGLLSVCWESLFEGFACERLVRLARLVLDGAAASLSEAPFEARSAAWFEALGVVALSWAGEPRGARGGVNASDVASQAA